jgi:FkbM family methyltransferase
MSHAIKNLARFYDAQPAGIIHIGANSGQEVTDYRESGIRPVVLIEALEAPFKRLIRAVGEEPGFYPVQACLSDTPGREVAFFVASNGGQASSYFQPGSHLDHYPQVKFDTQVTLVTQTLDDVLSQLAGVADISRLDYISLDTQGSELDILRGGRKALQNARFVYTEVSYPGLYKNAPSVYEVIDFMRHAGFDLCQLTMRTKGWGDARFAAKGQIGNS